MERFIFAVINFLLLFAIIYFIGRKSIAAIFDSRREKINRELDVDVDVIIWYTLSIRSQK